MEHITDVKAEEMREWLDAFRAVLKVEGPERARHLLGELKRLAQHNNVTIPFSANTPYVNTIPVAEQPPFPGSQEIERRIKNLVRWNAMAMVVQANKKEDGIGGHISTYASCATLLEIGFNHFFRGPDAPGGGDLVYFQGHASPGIYARAFLEGRLSAKRLENFRREMEPESLSSYPHPVLMPEFWQFSTVSMGLGAIMAIYQARFNRYLDHRGLKDTSKQKVWCFLGDGESDEPESLGALTLASREVLDNLIFVVNCNMQRLDGPVRGNGKIIQELEAIFRGAGWNVIKVIWGSEWDALLDKDKDGLLVQRMGEVVDGEYQKYVVEGGAYIRKHFFGKSPELLKMVEHLSDEQLAKLNRGGHDPKKVYAAFKAAAEHKGAPTVVLAKTVKGYGLGEAGEGRNITHQQKKLNEDELKEFRTRFNIPISDDDIGKVPFYRPADESAELQYLRTRRQKLGGWLPQRPTRFPTLEAPGRDVLKEFFKGSGEGAVTTTAAFVGILKRLLAHKEIGKLIVPIIPDEARTFGMDALFSQIGIYSNVDQQYEPVDANTLKAYRERKDGQLLEEGITEAGAMSSLIAAGTAYAIHGIPTIPFFIFYSMFGFQRIGDLIWAAADMRTRGFLVGGTAGRTTLNGEGLQHEDGHSHLVASTVPSVIAYDPAYAFELALIIQDGIRRMYQQGEDVMYYITLYNEKYPMPALPEGDKVREGVLKGIYKLSSRQAPHAVSNSKGKGAKVHLLGSGSLLREALRAQEILAERFEVTADVWSVTSYKELRRDALDVQRWNMLHPTEKPRRGYLQEILAGEDGVFIAVSDYIRSVPEMIAPWVPGGLYALGTDGFGRSESRQALRRFFEVDAECITLAALHRLAIRGDITPARAQQALKELKIDPDKLDPLKA